MTHTIEVLEENRGAAVTVEPLRFEVTNIRREPDGTIRAIVAIREGGQTWYLDGPRSITSAQNRLSAERQRFHHARGDAC